MKILTVIGARPQFIKAAVVSRAIELRSDANEVLVHTGQHSDDAMSTVFFTELDLRRPHYNLGVAGGSHGDQTGRMLIALEPVVEREKPDWILIYGDTNSTLAGALVGSKLHIPIAHVEAGLRSFNRRMPEEVNRVVADHLSTSLYAPTQISVDNLSREGISPHQIHQVGDVMYDAALYYANSAGHDRVGAFSIRAGEYVLATIHRAENTDDSARLRSIINALVTLSHERTVVLPLHPRTRIALERIGIGNDALGAIKIMPPLGYLDMVALERAALLIVTDSGGVQKEAFFHRVPCVTIREETEWVELVNSGWNLLSSPTDTHAMVAAFHAALEVRLDPTVGADLYGAGDAGQRIAEHLAAGPA